MPRKDLLALTPDDLAALTNRGTVKRALREIEAREVTADLVEDAAGTVTATWSDQVTCTLPGTKTVSDATCSCIATVLCRHVVRTVIAYQVQQQSQADAAANAAGAAGTPAPPKPPEPWDPGAIDDAALDAAFKKPVLTSARTRFGEGLLVELVRSAKPTARFHQMACTLRFVVPGDVRYTHCDCAETAPCSHVPLAVWAFRMLPAKKSAGLVATQQIAFPVPVALLDTGEALMRELAIDGISGVSPTLKDRLLRLAEQCEDQQLIWPAQVLTDLVQELERYTTHDARFSAEHVAQLLGEWLIRAGAIRSQTTAAPQLLIRGSKSDRTMEISGGRFIGLGCDVQQDRTGVDVTAYLQDADSGTVVGVGRSFSDAPKPPANPPGGVAARIAPVAAAPPDPPREFCKLAETPIIKGANLNTLGAGQMVTKGGKRTADHRLTVGRAPAAVTPQTFAWESLRAPVLAEDFQELRARLAILPPASLRPRLIAENLHVCPVARVVAARFNEMLQAIEILVEDARAEQALISHPYVDRGRQGAEALLTALANTARRLKFVSGHVRLDRAARGTGGAILIHPVMLVFEGPQGRIGVQPWVERLRDAAKETLPPARPAPAGTDAVSEFPGELLRQSAELLLLGLRRADPRLAKLWTELDLLGKSLGFSRLLQPATRLAAALTQKSSTPRWSPDPAAQSLLELVALAKLAQDLG